MSDRFRELESFVRVAERRSMTLAAQDLGLSSSGVSKLISALERRHKTRFVNRTTRQLSLTAEGAAYLERARAIVNDMHAADSEVANFAGGGRGIMNISMPTGLSSGFMVPSLLKFIERYPELKLRLLVTDGIVNLIEEQLDLAFRTGSPATGQLADSSLVARRAGDFERVICASPGYLKRCGTPQTLADLASHKIIAAPSTPAVWVMKRGRAVEEVKIEPAIICDSMEMMKALGVAGAGIFRSVRPIVEACLRSGSLVPVLSGYESVAERVLYAVAPGRGDRMNRGKELVDIIAEAMRASRGKAGK